MLTRNDAWQLLNEHVHDDVLLKHSRETEVIMRALARRLGHDENLWGTTGLLHDLDFETTKQTPDQHTLRTVEILAGRDVPPEAIQAIKAHNWDNLGIERVSTFDYALAAAESITGMLVATALVQPDKKLANVKVSSVKKKLKAPAFARAVQREPIYDVEKIGLTLDEFIQLSLGALNEIHDEIGL
ncbi:MAG: HDIG domain-containing protein [Verrucomicrobia bacterium]|nr:HDIG domain-containing protein [Verrucomicrobiota bacterium]